MKNIGERIRGLRVEKGLSVCDLARVVCVREATIKKWESGRTRISIPNLLKIKEYFCVSMDYLLGIKSV